MQSMEKDRLILSSNYEDNMIEAFVNKLSHKSMRYHLALFRNICRAERKEWSFVKMRPVKKKPISGLF